MSSLLATLSSGHVHHLVSPDAAPADPETEPRSTEQWAMRNADGD